METFPAPGSLLRQNSWLPPFPEICKCSGKMLFEAFNPATNPALRYSRLRDWAEAISREVGPEARADGAAPAFCESSARRSATVWRHGASAGASASRGLQFLFWLRLSGRASALSRRRNTTSAGHRVIGRFGEFILGGRGHRALGFQHQGLTELGVQGDVGRGQGDSLVKASCASGKRPSEAKAPLIRVQPLASSGAF